MEEIDPRSLDESRWKNHTADELSIIATGRHFPWSIRGRRENEAGFDYLLLHLSVSDFFHAEAFPKALKDAAIVATIAENPKLYKACPGAPTFASATSIVEAIKDYIGSIDTFAKYLELSNLQKSCNEGEQDFRVAQKQRNKANEIEAKSLYQKEMERARIEREGRLIAKGKSRWGTGSHVGMW